MVKLVIPGNCQAQLIETMFSCASTVSVSPLKPVFEMQEAHKDHVLQLMHDADFIFAQRTSDDYFLKWLTPDYLRSAFPDKCIFWPNVYFDGYFPKTEYMYRHGIGKVLSPLEDYHLGPLLASFRRGIGVDSAVKAFENQDADAAAGFEASFAELEKREQNVDVAISDLLRAEAAQRRIVYTPNHPYNDVLAELGARLAQKAEIAFDRDVAARIPYVLDRIYLPAFPSIVKQLSLPFDSATPFRGVEVLEVAPDKITLGAARDYSLRDLVEAYWRIYDKISP